MKTVAAETSSEVSDTRYLTERVRGGALADFAELIKARLTLLVLVTTAVGFYLGATGPISYRALFHAVFGTALAAAGAAALNQWWERRPDALMERTKLRPIPAGRMSPRDGLFIGSLLGVAGSIYLAVACNWLSAILAIATIAIYIFAYTPLKRITATNTLVGAIPGAIPPLIGWGAASGDLALPAWSLFSILFFWQMPHFFAIAWMYRGDYARAGFRMLSQSDEDGKRSAFQSVLFSALLIPASALPALFGVTSREYLPIEIGLSALFLFLAIAFYLRRDVSRARRLFVGSIVYLPLLLAVLVLTKR